MIKKLEDKKKIDITRRDQAEPQRSLAQHGFTAGIGSWAIMKVTDDKKLNFIETFLTFRSSKFRSIPYNDTTVYGGKTVNTREIYAKLALAEIEKMPSFESRSKDDKDAFPADDDWQRLSDDFHLNFVIYRDNKGKGIADSSTAKRPNAPVYNVFKAKNGRYYPIRMNAGVVAAPGIPPGVGGPAFPVFNRGILGGAIDGVTFPVATFEPEEETGEFLKRTVGQPVRQGLSTAATKVGELGTSAKRGLSTAAAKASEFGTSAKIGISTAATNVGTAFQEKLTRPRLATPPRAPEVPIENRLGQLQDIKAPHPDDIVPPLAQGQSAQEANTSAIRGMFPEGGRRKTSSWRRSKPARYTRRKF
jgi:hypothetical protein